ncbi:MAG: AfsR/SARP family transcriptional regulator [Acidimicrobiales bacterium]
MAGTRLHLGRSPVGRRVALTALLCLAAGACLASVFPPRSSLMLAAEALRTPEQSVDDAHLLGCLKCVAWLGWLVSLVDMLVWQASRRPSTDGAERDTMCTATLGGVVSDGGGPSRRRFDRLTALANFHRRRVEMPDEIEPTTVATPPRSREASMLATAALLGARRRWNDVTSPDSADDLPARERPASTPGPGPADVAGDAKRPRFVMPAVHLEDPEWSRAVLGLLSRSDPTRLPAAALVLQPERVEVAFPGPVRSAAVPFLTKSPSIWAIERLTGTLADLPSTPTIVAASRRAGLATAWNVEQSRCLLDIVGCGSVALDGPPVAVGATLSDVVVELATRRWCDLDELIVVGFGEEILGLERVRCLPDIDAATHYLLSAEPTDDASRSARCLVVAPPIGKRSPGNLNPLRSLVELVHALPGTGLVCCDPSLFSVRCVWRLAAHRQTTELTLRRRNRPDVILTPPPALEDEQGSAHSMRSPSRLRRDGEAASEPGLEDSAADEASWEDNDVEESFVEPPGDRRELDRDPPAVVVRLLGPVDVVGATTSLDRRPRVTELVVYLALHPDGCAGESIATAVWPDRRVPPQTLANRLSEARQALGEAPFGRPRVRRVSGRHVLSPDVSTDWAEFERLTASGTSEAQWNEALAMIRGKPFEGLTECGWALLEGFVATIEGRIIDIACRLASRSLDDGNATHAEWALRRALMASPWDERLYRMLMVVNHASGNRGGVESALRSLAHVLDWRGDPIDGVHPETAQLYRQLVVDRGLA